MDDCIRNPESSVLDEQLWELSRKASFSAFVSAQCIGDFFAFKGNKTA